MTLREYARKVDEVRGLQRKYFQHHNPAVLTSAKQAEKELDRLTAEVLDDRPSLFAEGEAE